MITTILWDVDGTLLDFLAAEKAAIRTLFAEFGFGECTDEAIARYSKINRRYWEKLENGELCMRGGDVMLGYYKDPEGTAEVVDAEGWFHTGDLARVDEDGYYFLTGRKKNVIILGSGENVSPEELEGLLAKCPAVKECLVKEKGKKICAVVCCKEADQQTVRDFITETNRTLPLYKRMSAVEFSAQPLPRNAMGKLMR